MRELCDIPFLTSLGGRWDEESSEMTFQTPCGVLTLVPSGHYTWLAGPVEVMDERHIRAMLALYGASMNG